MLALKRTKELGISANPIHSTVWYEYFAGKNSNLNSSVDALMSIDGKLDEGSCTDLYDRFIIAGANSARDKEWSDRIEAVTERPVDVLTDGLTGVANRKCFDQELHAATEDSRASGEPLSLILADLDHFKNFSDTHGHQFGDQVLRLVGRMLHDSVKGKDTAARYGGEEFAIILPETSGGGATAVAENIRKTVASKRLVKEGSDEALGAVTLSLGVTSCHSGEKISNFIERADKAL